MNNENQNNEIYFNEKSGISEEEQREILEKINNITEKNKQSLSSGNLDEDKKGKNFKAKKKGQLFPILVNAIAIVGLATGLLIISLIHRETDLEVRGGAFVYNSGERALIEAIRKDARKRLADKDNEISQINLQITDIESELKELYSNNEELNSEQLALENMLKTQQIEYNNNLNILLDERAQILEEFRAREALLQKQLESRTKELAIITEDSAVAIDKAKIDLDNLSKEYSQSQSIEAQLTAFLANINQKIIDSQLEDALKTIQSAREFLNSPSFQSLRSIEARKELYNQTLRSYEAIILELNRIASFSDADSYRTIDKTITQLSEKNTLLEKDLAEKENAVNTFNQQSADLNRRLIELTEINKTLSAYNAALEESIPEKDAQIRTLTQSAETSRQAQSTLQTELVSLRQSINTNETTISELRRENESKDEQISNLNRRLSDIQNALRALQNEE